MYGQVAVPPRSHDGISNVPIKKRRLGLPSSSSEDITLGNHNMISSSTDLDDATISSGTRFDVAVICKKKRTKMFVASKKPFKNPDFSGINILATVASAYANDLDNPDKLCNEKHPLLDVVELMSCGTQTSVSQDADIQTVQNHMSGNNEMAKKDECRQEQHTFPANNQVSNLIPIDTRSSCHELSLATLQDGECTKTAKLEPPWDLNIAVEQEIQPPVLLLERTTNHLEHNKSEDVLNSVLPQDCSPVNQYSGEQKMLELSSKNSDVSFHENEVGKEDLGLNGAAVFPGSGQQIGPSEPTEVGQQRSSISLEEDVHSEEDIKPENIVITVCPYTSVQSHEGKESKEVSVAEDCKQVCDLTSSEALIPVMDNYDKEDKNNSSINNIESFEDGKMAMDMTAEGHADAVSVSNVPSLVDGEFDTYSNAKGEDARTHENNCLVKSASTSDVGNAIVADSGTDRDSEIKDGKTFTDCDHPENPVEFQSHPNEVPMDVKFDRDAKKQDDKESRDHSFHHEEALESQAGESSQYEDGEFAPELEDSRGEEALEIDRVDYSYSLSGEDYGPEDLDEPGPSPVETQSENANENTDAFSNRDKENECCLDNLFSHSNVAVEHADFGTKPKLEQRVNPDCQTDNLNNSQSLTELNETPEPGELKSTSSPRSKRTGWDQPPNAATSVDETSKIASVKIVPSSQVVSRRSSSERISPGQTGSSASRRIRKRQDEFSFKRRDFPGFRNGYRQERPRFARVSRRGRITSRVGGGRDPIRRRNNESIDYENGNGSWASSERQQLPAYDNGSPNEFRRSRNDSAAAELENNGLLLNSERTSEKASISSTTKALCFSKSERDNDAIYSHREANSNHSRRSGFNSSYVSPRRRHAATGGSERYHRDFFENPDGVDRLLESQKRAVKSVRFHLERMDRGDSPPPPPPPLRRNPSSGSRSSYYPRSVMDSRLRSAINSRDSRSRSPSPRYWQQSSRPRMCDEFQRGSEHKNYGRSANIDSESRLHRIGSSPSRRTVSGYPLSSSGHPSKWSNDRRQLKHINDNDFRRQFQSSRNSPDRYSCRTGRSDFAKSPTMRSRNRQSSRSPVPSRLSDYRGSRSPAPTRLSDYHDSRRRKREENDDPRFKIRSGYGERVNEQGPRRRHGNSDSEEFKGANFQTNQEDCNRTTTVGEEELYSPSRFDYHSMEATMNSNYAKGVSRNDELHESCEDGGDIASRRN